MNIQRLSNIFIILVMLFSSSAFLETKAASITIDTTQTCRLLIGAGPTTRRFQQNVGCEQSSSSSQIGDLRNGHTKLYESNSYNFYDGRSWSPDSKHFIYSGTRDNLYLGSVDDSPVLISEGEFLGWIDSNRYLYYADKNIVMGDIKGSKEIILVDQESFQSSAFFSFVLLKTQNR